MPRAVILKHAEFEGPARLAPILIAHGYTLEIHELYLGQTVPTDLTRRDVLVVMGGPMGVGDIDAPAYPFLGSEVELLATRIAQDAPVLGICLGAQLLAAAAGARVYPMIARDDGRRVYEVGWSEVAFHARSGGDAILDGLPNTAPMLHWHGDTFDLPARARCLASTSPCPNQAFQLNTRQFGLQFHCEVGAAEVDAFLAADLEFAERACGANAAEEIRRATQRHLESIRSVGDRLLSNVVGAMRSGD